MNNYFSSLLSRLGGLNALTNYANGSENVRVPSINYIALYNPTFVDGKAESFEELHKQILFFVTPKDVDDPEAAPRDRQNLDIVSLLRGSCSLAQEFGNASDGPITVLMTGSAVVVTEIEKDYFLACSVALPSGISERHEVMISQISVLITRAHRTFQLLNPPFAKILKVRGLSAFGEILKDFWAEFMENFNDALKLPVGPRLLAWPNCMNYSGVFGFLPNDNYKRSSVRIPDSSRKDLEDVLLGAGPAGVLIANFNKTIPKKHGLMHMCTESVLEKLGADSMADLYNLLEFHDFHNELGRLGQRRIFKNFFSHLVQESAIVSSEAEDVDSEEDLTTLFNLDLAVALEMLHPVNIANTLVVLPLSIGVNGIKYLGLAVNEQLPGVPSWWQMPNFRIGVGTPTVVAPTVEETSEELSALRAPESTEAGSLAVSGKYIVGLSENEISRLLVHLPTTSKADGQTESREYLVVIYMQNGIALVFVFDSSLEQLSQQSFYRDLEENVCEPGLEIINDSILLSSGGVALNNSISSLPNPISTMIKLDTQYADVDSDFFFIVYDNKDHYYQSSLPYLPIGPILGEDEVIVKLTQRFHNALYHLHDQLVDHFVVKTNMFSGVVNEHLYKFSSNKNNDWLFYYIRHKHKAIIIIRNYNSKNKQKPRVPEEGVLNQIGNSVYGYAHLGFLDNLGDDVKLWLEGLGRKEET